MKRVTLCLILAIPPLAFVAEPVRRDSATARVRACSVTVSCGGSGTLFRGRDGCVYCLTAAHVTRGEKAIRVCRQGQDEDGRAFGCWIEANVTHACEGRDLALLCLGRHLPAGAKCARLYRGRTPAADTPIYACGSQGLFFHHSLHRGFVVAVGRKLDGCLVDEDDVAGGPGTSGCGVFLRSGELIGVHVASNRLRSGLYVPVRVIRAWAKEGGFLDCLEDVEGIAAPKQ